MKNDMEEKIKVLLIDDEEIVLDSCTQILAGSNCQVASAMNGESGLQLVREFQPDLVFVDLKMPGISGFDVIESISAIDPTIVSIVITGFGTVSSAVEAMKKGAYDFLPKPFTPDEFRLIARRGIEKRKLSLETLALKKEKEALREQFAAIVSHELKSPLGAIQQNLYGLTMELSDGLTEDQKRRFDRMKIRIDDLLKLINTWLRAISGDIGQIRDNFQPLSIPELAAQAIESVQPHATRKDIEVIPSYATPLDQVNGDKGTLVEVLVNIIGNAIKYSRPGSQIHIKAENEGNSVAISVIDSGVGIAKEDLPFIFRDFYVGQSGSSGEKSSGIGLAISQRIIEAHNGSISVESELGKGSTFVIYLPALKQGGS